MTEHDPIAAAFLSEVKHWLEATGTAKTLLGREALNDPAFVDRLEGGRDVRLSTMRKVRAYMADHPPRESSVNEAAE